MNKNAVYNQIDLSVSPFVAACAASCRKLLAQFQAVKRRLLDEFRPSALDQARMVELALNEAEALAYQSGVPVLVFPLLAREKVEAVAAWQQHQRMVRRAALQPLAA